MKNKIKNTCKCLAFIFAALLLFNLLSEGMKSNEVNSVVSFGGFYQQEKDSLDVVLIGASEVYTGYAPTIAWQEQGITGYSLGAPAISGNLYKSVLKEVLRKQSPQAVVFEVNGFLNKDDYYDNIGTMHNVLDCFRWSSNRVEAIREVVPEDEQKNFFFPLATYHSEWSHPKKMVKNSFIKVVMNVTGSNYLKGVSTFSYAMEKESLEKRGNYHFTERGKEYLEELLTYCKEQGLENVLFYRAPHQYYKGNQEDLDAVYELVKSYGYDVLDCSKNFDEYGIDIRTDFYNREHMNVYGMEKFTKYLSSYLVEQYNIEGYHSEKIVKEWNKSAEKANKVFSDCKADTDAGVVRHYMETSVYVQGPTSEKIKEEIMLK